MAEDNHTNDNTLRLVRYILYALVTLHRMLYGKVIHAVREPKLILCECRFTLTLPLRKHE